MFLNKKHKTILVLLLVMLVGIKTHATDPAAVKGVLDLRKTDLSHHPVPLNGEWFFFWNKLLKPGDQSKDTGSVIPFPRLWQKTIYGGKELPAIGYATYKLTVLLPAGNNKLALYLPDTYVSYRLFVNNELFAESGSPDTTRLLTKPKWLHQTLELTIKADTLQLIFQVANFWHAKGGPYKQILIGDKQQLFADKQSGEALDIFLFASLMMCGLFFFGLYLYDRSGKEILFFALFCITYSYRIVGSGYYVLHTIFPDYPWSIAIHMEYLSLFLSNVFFALYTMYLYPKDVNKYIIWTQIWFCAALSVIVIFCPPSFFTQLINPFLVMMFCVIAYTFYLYIIAARKKRLGANYALMSTAVVVVVFLIINLQYFGLAAPQKALLFIGYFSFFLLQTLVLSFRFTYILKKAKHDAEQGLIAKSEFLSNMSHEIRTPLNSVIGLSHILLESNPREEQKEELSALLFSANNLLSIVNDILDYNKIEAGKIVFEKIEMDLQQMMKDIVKGSQKAATDKGIIIKLDTGTFQPFSVLGDPTRLTQVMVNLIQNAIKFTSKGYVLLQLVLDKKTPTTATFTISVKDTGIGIAQEKQKLIFDRFSQADTSTSRKFGGTGLGLAICKRILELQGSSLQLTSEPGRGSVFYFTQTFELSNKGFFIPATEKKENNYSQSNALSGVNVLLAEDNDLNILVTRTFIEKWGGQVDVAKDGSEVLQLLDIKKHHVILMDMHMPVIDGYETIRRLRQNGINTPIVALTASLPSEVKERTAEFDLSAILTKPFVPDELLKAIMKIVEQKS